MGLKAPRALISELTPGGGLILSVTRDRFDLDNPQHVRGAELLRQVMFDRVGEHDPAPTASAPRFGPY